MKTLETLNYGILDIVTMDAHIKKLSPMIDILDDADDPERFYEIRRDDYGMLVAVEMYEWMI